MQVPFKRVRRERLVLLCPRPPREQGTILQVRQYLLTSSTQGGSNRLSSTKGLNGTGEVLLAVSSPRGVQASSPSSREACKYQVIAASLVQTTCETWHHGSTPTPWNQGELRRQHLTKWPNTNRSVRGGQRTEFSPSFAFALALPCL